MSSLTQFGHAVRWGRVARVCGVVLACMVLPASSTGQSRAQLGAGHIDVKMVKVKGYDTPRAVVKAVIDAPPAQVWRVIGDCAGYSKTFDRVSNSKLLKRSGSTHICEIEVDMPFPFSDLVAVTTAEHKEGPDEWSRHWKLVRGDYTVNTGSWSLTPFDEAGTRTLVHYQLLAEPTTAIPDSIRIRAQESTLPDMMKRLRREVAALK